MNIENIQQRVRVYNKATGINFSYTRFYCFLDLLNDKVCGFRLKPYIERMDKIGIIKRYE